MSRNAIKQAARTQRLWPGTIALLGLTAIGAAATLNGCTSDAHPDDGSFPPAAAAAPTTRPDDPLAGVFGPAPSRSGTQLWSENCTRCHNARPPTYYSGAQWALVMHHMRSRANLTGEEERKILAFLQASATAD
jgi:hypothetical protein